MRTIALALFLALAAAPAVAQPTAGEDSQHILTVDHYVPNRSTVPSIAGQTVQLYVRERVKQAQVSGHAKGGENLSGKVRETNAAQAPNPPRSEHEE
jgi:hypothetical protein